MADIKIQTSSPDELAGGQKPLATDSASADRRGNEFPQNSLSFCRGANIESGSAPISGGARNDLNRGATVQGRQQENAKHVDQKCIEGSYPGDTRANPGDVAKPSLGKAADNGGPRNRVGQFANNGKTPQDAGFQTFPGNLTDSDAGN
jgi:hypothetical protein